MDRMLVTFELDDFALMPVRAHVKDAGIDLKTPVDVLVPAKGHAVVDTGVHINLPEGTFGMITSKSGLNINHGIQSVGTIDSGYTGSIKVRVDNFNSEDYHFKAGDKITQLIVIPCITPGDGSSKERGDNGFGSTGK